jgi:hypothetical protein
MPVTALRPIMAFSPSAQPGTNSSLKRTVIVLTFAFHPACLLLVISCLFLYLVFISGFIKQIKKKGPESLWIRGPWASLSIVIR